MKDLNYLLNQSDSDAQDKYLGKAINTLLDQEFKNELKEELKYKYGITKEHATSPDVNTNIGKGVSKNVVFIRFMMSIAAMFLLVIGVYFLILPSRSAFDTAQQYASLYELSHPGLTKGTSNEQAKNNAIMLFNERKWEEAATQFESITQKDDEVTFYTAMAYFNSMNYPKSISYFQTELLEASVYRQERNWYYGLALILNKENDKSREILSKIKQGDWKYVEASELLKKLNDE